MGLYKSPEIEWLNRSNAKKRENAANWNGGKRKTSRGYQQILMPEHCRADKTGYVMEHIVVWERETGVPVPKNCAIHHLNGDKADNRIENLCMMQFGAHTKFHHTGMKRSDETKMKIREAKKVHYAECSNHNRATR